jgi:hypothetical protein
MIIPRSALRRSQLYTLGQTHVQAFPDSLTLIAILMIPPIVVSSYFVFPKSVVSTLVPVYETRADYQAVPVTLYTGVSTGEETDDTVTRVLHV